MPVEFVIPGSFPSTPNLREHWAARAKRTKKQRDEAGLLTLWNGGLAYSAYLLALGGTVTLTRVAPRKLDSDNLVGSFKAIRDGIASALGVDDGDSRVEWKYAQERCKNGEQQVRVKVEAAKPSGDGGLGSKR